MKNVLLVVLSFRKNIDATFGLRKLKKNFIEKSELAENFSISILQLDILNRKQNNVKYILDMSPDLIGFSTMTTSIQYILDLIKEINNYLPNSLIALGGPQVSDSDWCVLEKTDIVDVIIRGEGEQTFYEVLEYWYKTDKLCSQSIQGISFIREDGEIIHTPHRRFISDLDTIPRIYDNSFEIFEDNIYCLETNRGCYNYCGFCQMPSIKFREHSLQYVLSEIENMAECGIKQIILLDTSFTYNIERSKVIAYHFKKYGIKYSCCAKAEELTPEITDILLDTGAVEVEFGLQAVHPSTLKILNRTLNRDVYSKKVIDFMGRVRNSNIIVTIDVMCGLPGDNLESFFETLDFAYNLRPHKLGPYPFQLLPNTHLYRKRNKYGIKFISPLEVKYNTLSRYNSHRFGLEIENFSFIEEELETGRRICLLFGILQDTKLLNLVDIILKSEKISISRFLNNFVQFLSDDFFSTLETFSPSGFRNRYIVMKIFDVFLEYAKNIENTIASLKITDSIQMLNIY